MEILDATLRNIKIDLVSDKTTTRNNAFGKLQDVLDRRSDEIDALVNSTEYSSDTKWPGLFLSVLEGMSQHVQKIQSTTNSSTLENKCGMYAQVLQRLVGVANARDDQISKKTLLENCLDAMENNQDMGRYFGICLFTIIDRFVVMNKRVWLHVKSSLYNQYLSLLFQIVQNSVTNNFYVNCLNNAIEIGLQHKNIGVTLETHLVPMLVKIEAEPSETGKMNLLKIAYLIAFETIVNKRIVTCQFMFGLAKHLFSNYNPNRIREEHRVYIIKILDLIVAAETVTASPRAFDQQNWNALLQGCTFIVEKEIERMDQSTLTQVGVSSFNAIFMDFAAKVCSLTFWDDDVWMSSTGSPQPQKRMKYLGKFQALINRTEATSSNARHMRKYSWRWMLILGKVMELHPDRITSDDYEQILQLLSEFQLQIQRPDHFQGFYLACKTLLECTETVEQTLDNSKISDLWHKIIETCARNSSSINQTSNENMMLIRLMLKHKQHKGDVFIESLLDIFFTTLINRSNESIQTLIALMLTFNINRLKDPNDKIEKILSYLLLKQRANVKISIVKAQGKPKPELVARLVVICNMYKSTIDEKMKEKWLSDALEYGQENWVNEEYTR